MYKVDIGTLEQIKEALSNSSDKLLNELDFIDEKDDMYIDYMNQVEENNRLINLIRDNYYV